MSLNTFEMDKHEQGHEKDEVEPIKAFSRAFTMGYNKLYLPCNNELPGVDLYDYVLTFKPANVKKNDPTSNLLLDYESNAFTLGAFTVPISRIARDGTALEGEEEEDWYAHGNLGRGNIVTGKRKCTKTPKVREEEERKKKNSISKYWMQVHISVCCGKDITIFCISTICTILVIKYKMVMETNGKIRMF